MRRLIQKIRSENGVFTVTIPDYIVHKPLELVYKRSLEMCTREVLEHCE